MAAEDYSLYIGIDVSTGPKPVTFVAVDGEQKAMALGDGDLGDVLAFAAGLQVPVYAAVTCPAKPNNGRMAQSEVRQSLSPVPEKGKFRALRQAEYELIAAGAAIPQTPGAAEHSLPWMKRGFTLVQWLEKLNYRSFPAEDAARQWLEIQPDAAFWSLLGLNPLPAGTLEGRIQRQLLLEDLKLPVPDAMEFFEEITRYKILKGNLPLKYVLAQGEINAWLAAHAAWLAHNHPDQLKRYGDEGEGLIFLPCK